MGKEVIKIYSLYNDKIKNFCEKNNLKIWDEQIHTHPPAAKEIKVIFSYNNKYYKYISKDDIWELSGYAYAYIFELTKEEKQEVKDNLIWLNSCYNFYINPEILIKYVKRYINTENNLVFMAMS